MMLLLFLLTSWWDSDYDYRQVIAVNNDSLSVDLTNFIFPVNWLDNATHTAGTKAIIDKDDATQLWVDSEGDSFIWILKPNFDYNANDSVWYYIDVDGAEGFSQDSAELVFDTTNKWEIVQHLNEATGNFLDRTYNNNDGSDATDVCVRDTTGMVNGGIWMDGSVDKLNCGTGASLIPVKGVPFSISLWVTIESSKYHAVVYQGDDGGGAYNYMIQINNGTNTITLTTLDANYPNDTALVLNTPYYLTVTFSGDTTAGNNLKLYFNSALNKSWSKTQSFRTNSQPFCIGSMNNTNCYNTLDGFEDEVRFISAEQSANWVKNDYLFQNGWGLTWRTEETPSVGGVFGRVIIIQ